jgi:alpha-1,3-mannosyltransferase
LWQSGLGPLWIVALWAAQEWAWNVFPSTDTSSAIVVGVLGLSVAGLLWGAEGADQLREKPLAEVSQKKRA